MSQNSASLSMTLSKIFTILLFIAYKIAQQAVAGAECSIDIKTIQGFEPLFLDYDGAKYSFRIPKDGKLEFGAREKVHVVCNSLGNDPDPALVHNFKYEIECQNDGSFKRDGALFDVKKLPCKFANSPTISGKKGSNDNTKDCADGKGRTFEVRFYIPGELDKFVMLFETCVDTANADVLYSTHTIHGASIKNSMTKGPSNELSWRLESFNQLVGIHHCYSKQTERVAALLGASPDTNFFDRTSDSKGLYFTKGHLNPDGDQLFRTWRSATYYYINQVPQWKIVNDGGVGNVETVVRDRASRVGDLKVITGGFGKLFYEGKRFMLSEDKQKVPVPKWIYKIVVNPKNDEMIAFVILNDPHQTTKPDDLPCEDLFDTMKLTWIIKQRVKLSNGYTIACKVSELMKKIGYSPIKDSGKILK